MRNKLKFIRNVLYKLEKSYGLPIVYHKILTHELDPVTGAKVTTYLAIKISRAIVLRAREFRSFVYDLAFISANKDFTTGGYFDPEDRRIIVRAEDLPKDFDPTIDDFIIFNNYKYEVIELFIFEELAAYTFLVRKLRGAPVIRIESVLSVMNLQQSSSSEIQDKLNRTVESVLSLTQELKEVL